MKKLLMQLRQGRVIVYPTEAVFGLGCDPDNEKAICTLLTIKNRSWEKGLILVAANYEQLVRYVNIHCLHERQRSCMFAMCLNPTTWLVPAHINTPYWLMGKFTSLAVRISFFKPLHQLCLAFGKPLVFTSANVSGYTPARTILEVYNQLGKYDFYMMQENNILGGFLKPSTIKNVITGELIRE